ncbi:MAG TPA: hypothetical protein VEW28_06640 [Candidatus Kapabacteria bacterium]|nr:hypothetical protein [Candidatus Kapabacteria bacterium]
MSQPAKYSRFNRVWKPQIIGPFVLVVLLLFSVSTAHSQALQITLTVSPHPSMRLSDWQSRRENVTLIVTNTSSKVTQGTISAVLSLNGSVVASTKPDVMQVLNIPPGQSIFFGGDIFPSGAISFSGDAKDNASRTGMLPEGSYELCVTIQSPENRIAISNHDCRPFFLTKFSLPVLLQPNDGSSVSSGLEPTTMFSWTPLVPAPSALVNYRVRFVELLPLQNPKQAILNNRPLFEKIVTSVTQLQWPQEFRLPATGGSFTWSVQAEDANGTPLVLPERFAEPFIVTALPSQEECMKLLGAAERDREVLLTAEERYWQDYSKLAELKKQFQDANDRVDVYEMNRLEPEVRSLEQTVERERELHETSRNTYDQAMEKYRQCLGH